MTIKIEIRKNAVKLNSIIFKFRDNLTEEEGSSTLNTPDGFKLTQVFIEDTAVDMAMAGKDLFEMSVDEDLLDAYNAELKYE